MASIDDDLELDVAGSEEKKSGGTKKWVIIIVAIVLLVGGGVAATLLLMGSDEQTSEQTEMTDDATADATDDSAKQAKQDREKKKKPKKKREGKPSFMDMTPAFVVNLSDTASDVKFLQVSVSLMSYSKDDLDQVREYTPLVKNKLVLLFSEQKFEELRTKAGKEKLQAEALLTVQQALKEMTGSEMIDALYITSIVGQ